MKKVIYFGTQYLVQRLDFCFVINQRSAGSFGVIVIFSYLLLILYLIGVCSFFETKVSKYNRL